MMKGLILDWQVWKETIHKAFTCVTEERYNYEEGNIR